MQRPLMERIARALCTHDGNPPNATMDGKPLWCDYLPEAQVVLLAIREPNDDMVDAGMQTGIERPCRLDIPLHMAWEAMIDAALDGQ